MKTIYGYLVIPFFLLVFLLTTLFLAASWTLSLFKKNKCQTYFATRSIYDAGLR